jgi:hypothetical protein
MIRPCTHSEVRQVWLERSFVGEIVSTDALNLQTVVETDITEQDGPGCKLGQAVADRDLPPCEDTGNGRYIVEPREDLSSSGASDIEVC